MSEAASCRAETGGILTQQGAPLQGAVRYTAGVTSYLSSVVVALAIGVMQAPNEAANTRLLEAAASGNVAEVRAAIDAGADVANAAGAHVTALGVACLYGHAAVVQALLAAGADVGTDQGGQTPLMLAAGQGHTAVVETLLAAGADLGAKDKDGLTALMAAASANRADTLRVLIARGGNVNAPNPEGSTALMAAAFGGHLEAVQVLLAAQADVNAKDTNGRTALMAASLGGSAPVARALLERKADLMAEDVGGGTSLIYAAANGHADFVELLQKAGLTKGTDMALSFAVRGCHAEVFKRLAAGGANVNARLEGQPTILLAAAANCGEILDFLIARGADVNAADDEGTTALMTAGGEGFVPIVQTLLDHGADLERTNKNQQNAWLIAAMRNQRDVVEIYRAVREKKGGPK
jgi:ankyrin repeat protein